MSSWDGFDEFLAVASTGSFTRAAHLIGMSSTHVSRSIMALERRVQAQLFHRTTRKVSLTASSSNDAKGSRRREMKRSR